jgi:hypothetical protein
MVKLFKAIAFIGILFIFGCSDEYFTDGGSIATPANSENVNTFDYLKSHKESFDTLATLIQLCGLESVVNAPRNTFLAPRDYSIHNYFKLVFTDPEKQPATLAAIPQDELNKITIILKNYIIPNEEILRNTLTTAYSYKTTYAGTKARFNIVKEDYLGNVGLGAQSIVFSLNMSAPGDKESYQSVQVISSDLRSTNGIIHVLNSDSHIFGFN